MIFAYTLSCFTHMSYSNIQKGNFGSDHDHHDPSSGCFWRFQRFQCDWVVQTIPPCRFELKTQSLCMSSLQSLLPLFLRQVESIGASGSAELDCTKNHANATCRSMWNQSKLTVIYISWLSFICDRNKASNFCSGASKFSASCDGKALIDARRVCKVTTESTSSSMSTFGWFLSFLSARPPLQGVGRENKARSHLPMPDLWSDVAVGTALLLLLEIALISRSESEMSGPGGGNNGLGGSGNFIPQRPHGQKSRRFRWPRRSWAPSEAHLAGGSSSNRSSRGPTRWRSDADRTWAPTKLPRAHLPKGSDGLPWRDTFSSTMEVSAQRGGLGLEANNFLSACRPSGPGLEPAWESKRILALFSCGSCALIASRILGAVHLCIKSLKDIERWQKTKFAIFERIANHPNLTWSNIIKQKSWHHIIAQRIWFFSVSLFALFDACCRLAEYGCASRVPWGPAVPREMPFPLRLPLGGLPL